MLSISLLANAVRPHWRNPMMRVALVGALTLLSGCSQKFNDVNDTLQLALFGEADTQLSTSDINQLPYASLYARISEGPQAFMVLAIAEPASKKTGQVTATPKLKWLSADRAMIVTDAGRIVKTVGLPQGNLQETFSRQADPLALGLHKADTPTTWQHSIDWQPGFHFGYTLRSEFRPQGDAVILVNDTPKQVLHFIEHVSVAELGIAYDNQFWIDPDNGRVWKSLQKPAPSLPYIELTLLKPFA